ncbi:NmrA family protein [Cordyceps javanica]|uniref:NmrA family protein n=1 Tax=Cordyceps javanica TaxID=43265 RepID=A0A545UYI7_9HYPO|nr:NmrA family protein [Cordyceps javanica]TQW06377.1 NmrA family protein [Cordyceps javanica]
MVHTILVLGAGELGVAVLQALASHPKRSSTRLVVLLRQATLDAREGGKAGKIAHLKSLGIGFEAGDVSSASVDELALIFGRYDTVVSCTGMELPSGTQTKLAKAAIQGRVKRYFPWQFGMDYDKIGQGSSQDLFDEQLAVRRLLREQSETEWVIVSTGLFMSFLFLAAFGVVDLDKRVVRGLGSWENRITLTTPQDIGRVTADVMLDPRGIKNQVVLAAGDTLSYQQVSNLVDAHYGGEAFTKELWTLDALARQLREEPSSVMVKYRETFAHGVGVAWGLEETVNYERNMSMTDAKTYLRQVVDIIQLLLESGVPVDTRSEGTDSTALHAALQSWSWDAAKCLLRAGAAVNAEDYEQVRPLHIQAVIVPVELTRMMVELGADPTARNSDGWSCAAMHAFHGRAATLTILLDAGADVNDQSSGSPLIGLAAASGKRDAFQLLLDRGADLSLKNSEMLTVFHTCIEREKFDLAEILLEGGTDVDLVDDNDVTALYAAIERDSQRQFEFLLSHGANISKRCNSQTPLQCAVRAGRQKIVKVLLDRGATVAACKDDHQSPLSIAVEEGHVGIARLLLARGADSNLTNDCCTMLQMAHRADSLATFRLLLENGVDVDRAGCDGYSPLYTAAWHGKLEIVTLLTEHGADINNGGSGDWSPVQAAVENGHLPILEYLVQRGANTDTEAVGQKSSLVMIASAGGKLEVVKWLLANTSLRVDDVDAFGRTALHYAARTGRVPVMETLATTYPDILSARDLTGATAFMLAARNGHTAALQSLLRAIGTSVLADRDDGDHSPIYWAKRCRETVAAETLSNCALESDLELPADAFSEEEDDCRVQINAKGCYCDICGCHSTAPPNIEAFECHECFPGEEAFVVICGICARDRGKCLEVGHDWKKHVCECIDEEDAESEEENSSEEGSDDEWDDEDEDGSVALEDEVEDESDQGSSSES